MSDSPSQELLEAIATELAVDPSFIEKDWHTTQVIAGITKRGSAEPAPVFSGGTSLSTGYGLTRMICAVKSQRSAAVRPPM